MVDKDALVSAVCDRVLPPELYIEAYSPDGFYTVDDSWLDNAGFAIRCQDSFGLRTPRVCDQIMESAFFHMDKAPDALLRGMFAEQGSGYARLGEDGRLLVWFRAGGQLCGHFTNSGFRS